MRSAVFLQRLHRAITDAPLSDRDDAVMCALALLGMDIAEKGRAACQERARVLLALMDPANEGELGDIRPQG